MHQFTFGASLLVGGLLCGFPADVVAQSSQMPHVVGLVPCDGGSFSAPVFGSEVAMDRGIIAARIHENSLDDSYSSIVCVYDRGEDSCCSLVAPDGSEGFGRALAVQGNKLFVGDNDRVLIYQRIKESTWVLWSTLALNQVQGLAVDGRRLAVSQCDANKAIAIFELNASGDYMMVDSVVLPDGVGCFRDISLEDDLLLAQGVSLPAMPDSVFVYRRSRFAWSLDAVLQDGSTNDDYGQKVQLWRGDAYICAPRGEDKKGPLDTGVVFVYRDEGSGWKLANTLSPRPGQRLEAFGGSIRIGEEGLFIGSYLRHSRQGKEAGAVYHYRRQSLGEEWALAQLIRSPIPKSGANFGWDLCVDRGILVVGAPWENSGGAVYCIDIEESARRSR